MNFEDWYGDLPAHVKNYVKTFAFHPTESNKGFITGYLQAYKDCNRIEHEILSFWFTWNIKVLEELESAEKYFE
jgi:hypothetical protein